MKRFIVLGVYCLVLLLSATGIFAQGFTGTNTAPQIDGVRALQIAQTRAPAAGMVISMEWELKRGWSEWDVTIIQGQIRYDVKIDATSGQITSYRERQYAPRQPLPQPPANRISFETIRQNAQSSNPSGIIQEIEYGYKHLRWVFEVKTRVNNRNTTLYYDAVTGQSLQLSGRNPRTWL